MLLAAQFSFYVRPRGPIDKASDYESEDSGFESWRGRVLFLLSTAKKAKRLKNQQIIEVDKNKR